MAVSGAEGRMRMLRRLRDLPGVLVRDLPRYRAALTATGSDTGGWASLCNRNEVLRQVEGCKGFQCQWKWGSELHAPLVLPSLGRRLMWSALRDWPIRFADRPVASGEAPRISFVIAHSGQNRVAQLVQTLRSLFAQVEVPCECIVVDQSETPLLERLPPGIVYRHLDKSGMVPGWRKSWAFNVGARLARADILVFHDGDICAPAGYARELLQVLGDGRHAAASVQRMLFYLTNEDTKHLFADDSVPDDGVPSPALQNWKGGTIAIRKDAFKAIGGFDEGFVDWGGEDDEFYDRCQLVGHCRAGYLPFVHLWHAPQAKRHAADNINTTRVLPVRFAIPREDRVAQLNARAWGDAARPDPIERYT